MDWRKSPQKYQVCFSALLLRAVMIGWGYTNVGEWAYLLDELEIVFVVSCGSIISLGTVLYSVVCVEDFVSFGMFSRKDMVALHSLVLFSIVAQLIGYGVVYYCYHARFVLSGPNVLTLFVGQLVLLGFVAGTWLMAKVLRGTARLCYGLVCVHPVPDRPRRRRSRGERRTNRRVVRDHVC